MGGWGCPHEINLFCQRLKQECDPGVPGCILYGLVEREDVPLPPRRPRRREALEKTPNTTPGDGEDRTQKRVPQIREAKEQS